MRITSLCYIERDGQYLMLHRVRKKHDENEGKWIGVGGGFLENESPEECCRREVLEETGLRLTAPELRAVVTFVMEGGAGEYMFLFTCSSFEGELADCDEGELAWVPKEKISELELWEGDRFFLRELEESGVFFTMKLVYDRMGKLLLAEKNGTEILFDRRTGQ